MKKLLLSLLAVAASINAFGWELDLGLNVVVRAGMNFSNIATVGDDSKEFEKGDILPGYHVDVLYDWRIVDCFYIQPGLSYTTRGSDFSSDELNDKIKIGYLQVPLLASYRFTLGEKQKFALNCGTTYGYAVSGMNEYEYYNSNNSKIECSDNLFEDGHDYNRFEFGVNLGVSYFIKNHFINFSWDRGLTKIYEAEGYDCKLKNNNMSVTVGYTF